MTSMNALDAPPRATVLLVDDSLANLTIFGEVLQPTYNVRVANTGERALEVVNSDPTPDIILLDVMMPRMDGYAMLQTLRKNPKHHGIPVVFVTAVDKSENEEFGLALGAVDFITKPIKPAILLARIKTHLRLKTGHDAVVRQNHFLREELARLALENRQLEEAHREALKTIAATNSLFARNADDEVSDKYGQRIDDTYPVPLEPARDA